MSRNGLIVAVLALVVAVVAVILPFVLSSGGGADSSTIDALQARIEQLESQAGSSSGPKIAYINVEDAFQVFLTAVSGLREQAQAKTEEIASVYTDYASGLISQEDYQQQMMELQAELLDAQITIDVSTIQMMIESDAFADIRSDLEVYQEQAANVSNVAKDLVQSVRTGVMSTSEYQGRFEQIQEAFNEIDQVLTSAATYKIVQAAQTVAREAGYDLVLRKEDVIVFPQVGTVSVPDITETVKLEIAGYL